MAWCQSVRSPPFLYRLRIFQTLRLISIMQCFDDVFRVERLELETTVYLSAALRISGLLILCLWYGTDLGCHHPYRIADYNEILRRPL